MVGTLFYICCWKTLISLISKSLKEKGHSNSLDKIPTDPFSVFSEKVIGLLQASFPLPLKIDNTCLIYLTYTSESQFRWQIGIHFEEQ